MPSGAPWRGGRGAGCCRRRGRSGARIVLACADGGSIGEVAEQVGCGRSSVTKWRSRFLAERLEGLDDDPRPGRPRTITDDQVDAIIDRTLQSKPANGDTHWSTRSMAQASGLNQTAVSRIWRAFGLKPHAIESWKLSTDLPSWTRSATSSGCI
jgi:transposase